jgi:hypothetical protein
MMISNVKYWHLVGCILDYIHKPYYVISDEKCVAGKTGQDTK